MIRIETGEGEWVGVEKNLSSDYYDVTFGYNDNEVDAQVTTSLDELRQIVAAIEKMESSMIDTLEALRAKVEAAQALAVKATPGPWVIDERVRCAAIVSPARVDSPGLGRSYAGVLAFWYPSHRWQHEHADDPLAVWDAPLGDMAMMAAAPDLVTLATDLLAEADRLRLRVAELEAADDEDDNAVPIGQCPECVASWYTDGGFCGGCRG